MHYPSSHFFSRILVLIVLQLACFKSFSQKKDSTGKRYDEIKLVKPRYKSPDTSSRIVDNTDYFIIKVSGKRLFVKYHDKALPVSDSAQLDLYFKKNLNKLQGPKFLVVQSTTSIYKEVSPVLNLLHKYHVYRFSLETLDE